MKMGYFYSILLVYYQIVFCNFGVNLIRTEKIMQLDIIINLLITPVKYGKQNSRVNR